MDCLRCGGLTVLESLSDMRGTLEWVEALRCLNCGHIEDPVMHAHRAPRFDSTNGGVPNDT
jgi:hypothetical protein